MPHAAADHAPLIDLRERVALVTGGSRNIGRATAVLLARAGARVAVIGRQDRAALDETLEELEGLGAACHGALADLADLEGLPHVVDQVEAALGPVDVLVNNAAIRPAAEVGSITAAQWRTVLDVNLVAPFLLAQEVLPGMVERRWGRIINVSGVDAFWGKKGRPHVTSSKAGLLGLTRSLAVECAESGVTVNAIVPGTTDTQRHTPEWYPDLQDFYAARIARTPMARLGRPDEVAGAVVYLASDLASYVTAHTLFVTGGAFPTVRC